MKTHIDYLNDTVTFDLNDGRCIKFSHRMVQKVGIAEALRRAGLADQIPTGRVPVTQHGQVVGTLPAHFDPAFARSSSFFYDVRPGDFEREGSGWRASRTLCPGDLEALIGFSPA